MTALGDGSLEAVKTQAPVISLSEVTVSYPGTVALDGLSLVVNAAERVALVGPSGAGKSTLIGLCNGTVQPTSGRVEILGESLNSISESRRRALRSRVATVHQRLHLVGPLRVVHNVNAGRIGTWPSWKALLSLIRPIGTKEVIEALARMGVDHKVHERTDRLSGGEQQRVALARVLVQNPALVLADEPVSSLDPSRARGVMHLLRLLAADGRTLVVSLHAFDLAKEYCDRIVGLRDGRILFDLPASDVDSEEAAQLYRIGER